MLFIVMKLPNIFKFLISEKKRTKTLLLAKDEVSFVRCEAIIFKSAFAVPFAFFPLALVG